MTKLPTPVRIIETSRAPNPRRLRIFMAEKNISIPIEQIDIMNQEHKTSEYIAKAGAPVIPILELSDGSWLSESVAICRYLEAMYPENNLMGENPLELGQIEMWNRRMELGLFAHIAAIFRHTSPHMKPLEDQVPEWAEANRPRLMKALKVLDDRLMDSAFIAGDRFTIADITAWVALDFMRVTKIQIPDEYQGILNWHGRMQTRGSATA